ncbi:MAG: hypothetical protein AAB580_03155 [Patescibacteria group bacterium]
MIFIDADAFIALNFTKDVHYKKACILMEKLEEKEDILVTSWQVIDEVATKLSYFGIKQQATNFLKWITNSDIKIVYVNEKMTSKIIKQFKEQTSKRVSLTDCTNMVIAEEMGVKQIFSFDKHYKQNGFELLGK